MIRFFKYQGTGNDFILIDNRDKSIELTTAQIAWLCNRRMGVGADGLMLLETAPGFDFKMIYFNADGSESTMCGNGGRCISAFAKRLGIVNDKAHFLAIDGPHDSNFLEKEQVCLAMIDVENIKETENGFILNTGSPHYIKFAKNLDEYDVFQTGRTIRNLDEFQPKGINVNFVERLHDKIYVRTYERGVEDETLSCGTGVTAAAIASVGIAIGQFSVDVITKGGSLNVQFQKLNSSTAKQVKLTGPTQFVFSGEISI